MSFTRDDHHPIIPNFWDRKRLDEHVRKITLAVNGILRGETNNGFFVTLEANQTSTTVTEARIIDHVIPSLTPLSATAATAIGAGVVWVEPRNGSFVIHHDSQPATDRKYAVAIFG